MAALRDEVHVWTVSLQASAAANQRALCLLDAAERDRASRFHFDHLKSAFAISRAALRIFLANYLGVLPGAIEFVYGPQGKPGLAAPRAGVRFNVSHSGDILVAAFTVNCDVGIDVERIRTVEDYALIARRYFHPGEVRDIEAAVDSERPGCWFRCWTRKEAYIKAVGGGLSIPLDGFRVSVLPGEPARFLELSDGAPAQWRLHHLDPAPGYAGAVALRGPDRRLVIHSSVPADHLL